MPLLPWPGEVVSGNGQISKKMNNLKLGVRSHNETELFGTGVRLGKNVSYAKSVTKVCESLGCLTGRVPKICFRYVGNQSSCDPRV